jgi:methylmalonyl-CoA/ethylmalonyl-CoA epimerase
MMSIRRLDHVAIVVEDTETALRHFRDRLGLRVAHTEVLEQPRLRLTYLDVGNTFIQLVQPLDDTGAAGEWLAGHGDGLHHICFGVDDPLKSAEALSTDGTDAVPGAGRGRVSAFVPGHSPHGVRIECTEFRYELDVDETPGWLAN